VTEINSWALTRNGYIQSRTDVSRDMTAETDQIKKTLQARRAEIMARQERVSNHTRHRDEPLPADFAEQAIELENGETLVALDQEMQEELARLDKALARLQAGNYFECESCGEEIGAARLKALPGSSLCIDCARDSQ
jgi:RNA polymerase-binding protein DksA